MAKHIFYYQIKILLRERRILFWNLLFPMILGTLFYLAFHNLATEDNFSRIPIAVIYEEKTDETFQSVLKSISVEDGNTTTGDNILFSIQSVKNEQEAKTLLADGKIKAYLIAGETQNLVIKENGYEQTIIKSFLDNYKQRSKVLTDILTQTQGKADEEQILQVLEEGAHITSLQVTKEDANYLVIPFYSLMAMCCMNASMIGVHLVLKIQANQSTMAARNNLAPISKHKILLSNLAAIVLLQSIVITVLFLYLSFGLKISFGKDYGQIFLTNIIGVIVGILFGITIGVLVKGKEGIKISLCTSITMLGSFLAGMMSTSVKYLVQTKMPILAKINPVNLITDAYYCLYYYTDYNRFWSNMIGLIVMACVLTGICIFVLRRQQYESI